jgi:hypothetical protein
VIFVEIIAKGKSLDEIRKAWAEKWQCSPEKLELTVPKKPGIFNKNWTVNIQKRIGPTPVPAKEEQMKINWDGNKYIITPGKDSVIVPFPMVGKVIYKGRELFDEFTVDRGEYFEYYPLTQEGQFSWELKVNEQGSQVLAKVIHERPGRYILKKEVSRQKRWLLENWIEWQESDWEISPEKEKIFKGELEAKGIIYGLKDDYWERIINVQGVDEVVVAEQLKPIPPQNPVLEDFESYFEQEVSSEEREYSWETQDYFASKIFVCAMDDVIAKKLPGREGTPGIDIFGKEIPVSPMQDFNLRPEKILISVQMDWKSGPAVPGHLLKWAIILIPWKKFIFITRM